MTTATFNLTLTAGQNAQLEALAAMPDNQINTRDIPEQRDWTGARRGLFFRPVKKQLTLRRVPFCERRERLKVQAAFFAAVAMVAGLLLPHFVHARALPAAVSQCSTTIYYLPTTCACIQRVIPSAHLTGKLADGACPFSTPPPSFDPSTASIAELDDWGIPHNDARALKDPKVREAYFHGVVREFAGLGCNKGICGPSQALTWRPSDGAQCNLPGDLSIYCFHSMKVRLYPHGQSLPAGTAP